MQISRHFILVFIALTMFSQAAFSWGLTGHRVVAAIAQQHLSKKAKAELHNLIGQEQLVWWANWPDFVKSDSTFKKNDPWHYVNVAPNNYTPESFEDSLRSLKVENLYWAINTTKATLKNKLLSPDERRQALYFLIHLVGDLHQPLHVGRAEDLGGNRIQILWFDRPTNLHSFWDNAFVDFQQYSYSEYACLLNIAPKEKVTEWSSGSLESWVYESHLLANKIYNSVKPGEKIGYRYNYDYLATLNEQLLKGGIRLGAVLNEVFQ